MNYVNRVQSEKYFICSERVLLLHIFEAMNKGFNPLAPRYFCHFMTFPPSRACLRDCHICIFILRHALKFNVEAREGNHYTLNLFRQSFKGSGRID